MAAARNVGVRNAAGDFVAPLDADDVWHPSYIEKLMAVLLSGGADMAAVYTGCRVIDENYRVIGLRPIFTCQGHIFGQLLCLNMVGNGSGLLMRKNAALAIGGYESALRTIGAEGCEDWLLELMLALRYSFGFVPEYLVGYMKRPGNMSSDLVRMLNAEHRVLELAGEIAPAFLKPFARLRVAEARFLMGYHMFKRGQLLKAIGVIICAHTMHIGCGIAGSIFIMENKMRTLRAAKWRRTTLSNSALRHFAEYDPKDGLYFEIGWQTRRRFDWIAAKDQHNRCPEFSERLPNIVAKCD